MKLDDSGEKKFWLLVILFFMVGSILSTYGCRSDRDEKSKSPGRSFERGGEGGFTVGVLVAFDSPTSEEVLKAFAATLEKYQETSGQQFEIVTEKAHGQMAILPELAGKMSARADLLVPISTPALQAVMISTEKIPVVFSSVANPYILRAGRTAVDHDQRITGVCSTAPIRQIISLIKKSRAEIKRIGTIWTPSEVNSQYYLELMSEAADELGLELISTSIDEADDLIQAFHYLVQCQVQVVCPVSDNTINANFEQLARLAEENCIPLFAAFGLGAELGACASLGFSFTDIGRKTAELVIRIRNGESPALIPFQYMDKVLFYINEEASRKQGITWPSDILKQADAILKGTTRKEQGGI